MANQSEFTLFGRNIPRTTLLGVIIVALVVSNIITLQQSTSSDEWYNERYIDNMALTQNAFENLFHEFDELLNDETLDEQSIMDLESWVEKTSVQSAMVTFLDKNHFDLWSETSDRLEQFETFLEDLRTAVREQSTLNNVVSLNEENVLRLQAVYDSLRDYYEFVFPVDVIAEGTLWVQPHSEEYDTAFEKLGGFDEAVGESWLIISWVRGSKAAQPEVQARDILVDAVGEPYFQDYFELWIIERNEREPEEWLTGIVYFYHIEVGDYKVTREVCFHFDVMNELISAVGVPGAGNLMPFNVTREEAIEVASGNITRVYVEIDAEIYYKKSFEGVFLDRYLWSVQFYHTKKDARSGTVTSVYVDPNSGEVLGIGEYGWDIA